MKGDMKTLHDKMAKAFKDACKKNGLEVSTEQDGNMYADNKKTGITVISWIWNEELDDHGF